MKIGEAEDIKNICCTCLLLGRYNSVAEFKNPLFEQEQQSFYSGHMSISVHYIIHYTLHKHLSEGAKIHLDITATGHYNSLQCVTFINYSIGSI